MAGPRKPPSPIHPPARSAAGSVSSGRWPSLFGAAGRAYGRGVRAALERAGFGDVPIAGSRVIGVLARRQATIGEIADRLDLTKQAVSRMCDALVERGYVERSPHERDRRRMVLALTDRGRQAAWTIGRSVKEIDDELARHLDSRQMAALARGLESFARQASSGDPTPLR